MTLKTRIKKLEQAAKKSGEGEQPIEIIEIVKYGEAGEGEAGEVVSIEVIDLRTVRQP